MKPASIGGGGGGGWPASAVLVGKQKLCRVKDRLPELSTARTQKQRPSAGAPTFA